MRQTRIRRWYQSVAVVCPPIIVIIVVCYPSCHLPAPSVHCPLHTPHLYHGWWRQEAGRWYFYVNNGWLGLGRLATLQWAIICQAETKLQTDDLMDLLAPPRHTDGPRRVVSGHHRTMLVPGQGESQGPPRKGPRRGPRRGSRRGCFQLFLPYHCFALSGPWSAQTFLELKTRMGTVNKL